MELNGEMTSINLKIIKDSDQGGRVTVTMQTEKYGQTAAEFRVNQDQVEGYIGSDSKEGLEALSKMEESLREALKTEDREVKNLNFIYSKEMDINRFEQGISKDIGDTSETTGASTKELYEVAKAFIITLRARGGRTYEN